MQLYFRLRQFPRTITRSEWKEIWRWKRVTEKMLKAREEEYLDVLRSGLVDLDGYGTCLFEHVIDPPFLIHHKMSDFYKEPG